MPSIYCQLVAPGGLLVLVTCSLEQEENEAAAAHLLEGGDGFQAEDLSGLPQVWQPWVAGPGLWRLFPGGEHDGFTVQVLRRQS